MDKKIYYIKKRSMILNKSKKWAKENPEKRKEQTRRYRKKYPEKEKARQAKYRINNLEKINEYSKSYYGKNKIKIKEKAKKWRKDNPEKVREYFNQWEKNRRKTVPKYSLNKKMSRMIKLSLQNNKNGRHWEDLVGYKLEDLIKRLGETIPEGYAWRDFLEGKLHIDHIIPKSVFNYTKPEHLDFKNCWALNNLQLLPAKENRIKSSKLTKPFQPALKI